MDNLFLLNLAKAWADHSGYTLSTVSSYAAGDSAFFSRIEQGGDCTTQRAKKVAKWFSRRWPDDLEWPKEVPIRREGRVRTMPFSQRCANPNIEDQWTCPGCYADLGGIGVGDHTCLSCGRALSCSLEHLPVCITTLSDRETNNE